jgi:GntR family transcriptional regulator
MSRSPSKKQKPAMPAHAAGGSADAPNEATLPPPPHWLTGTPLHRQLKDHLVDGIAAGRLRRGDPLPTEHQLAQHYRVSVSTVRAAMGALAEAGLVVRRAGRGTHVAPRGGKESVYQFFRLRPDAGPSPSPISEVTDFARVRASAYDQARLALPGGAPGEWVYRLRNVLRLGQVPVQMAEVTLAAHLFPKLTAAKLNATQDTLYAAYQTLYGITAVRTEDEMRAIAAPAAAAKAFGIAVGSPVLQLTRVSYSFNDLPIEWRVMLARTDGYHFAFAQGGA